MLKKQLKRLGDFAKTDLFKTSLWNGLATLVKIMTSLVSNKIVAVYLGPAGIALMGQFSNFTSIANSIAGFGINNGVTKYLAQYKEDDAERIRILSTGLKITLATTLVASLVVFIGAGKFCLLVLRDNKYVSLFYVFSVTLFLFSLNGFLISVLNGYKEFKSIIAVNITSSFIGLAITAVLVYTYGVWGALVGMILSTTLVAFVTLIFVTKSKWFKAKNFTSRFNGQTCKKLLHYTVMAFTSLFAVNYIQLMTRTYIITHLSIADAGYWQGIVKISDVYLMLITSTLSIYYLPRLSEIKDNAELFHEIGRAFAYVIPLTVLLSLGIYLFRYAIIGAMFSKAFLPMEKLYFPQLVGNVLKIATWLIGILTIARSMTLVYVVFEVVGGCLFYLITVFCLNKYGLIGASYSYAATYLLYFIAFLGVLYYLKRQTPPNNGKTAL